jgi:hypothetical protein
MTWLRTLFGTKTPPPVVHPVALDHLEQELARMENLIRRYRLPVAVETDRVFEDREAAPDVE